MYKYIESATTAKQKKNRSLTTGKNKEHTPTTLNRYIASNEKSTRIQFTDTPSSRYFDFLKLTKTFGSSAVTYNETEY